MYWEQNLETMERRELERHQLRLANASLAAARRSPHYAQVLAGFPQRGLSSLAGLNELPLTGKAELRAGFPYGFLAVPQEEVVRLHSSSGTTGNPTVVYHTRGDIAEWENLIARCMYATGVRRTDVFQNMMGYGLFTGGIGFHYGAERLGVMTIPIGPGNSKRQIWFLQHLGTTVIHCTWPATSRSWASNRAAT
jgi:phenylacetate-CoA ligase